MAAKTHIESEIVYGEPFAMARRLKGSRALILFESAQRNEHLGRYSFLACDPQKTLVVRNGKAFVDSKATDQAPFDILAREVARSKKATLEGLPPFQGGWAGYIAYDYNRQLEPKAKIKAFQPICPDMVFHRYDTVIAIDHLQERAWIIGEDEASVKALEKKLARRQAHLGSPIHLQFAETISRETHERNIRKTVDYILAGDIFQANITQTFTAAEPERFDPFTLYQQLRENNPAPFAALLDFEEIKIISSSPERLISCVKGKAEARPIKGTRRRAGDPAKDAALIADLISSRKDRAENVMIVDLLRNDLSLVCKPGTVRVPVLCGLETYANVHHLVSVVQGDLHDDLGAIDLVKSVFPGGSITGAPKIRAMEIIAELEQAPRGVYCGTIGYFGFNGTCDFNIAIRTIQVADGLMRVQGGGGITARSDAAAEYEESLVKISRIREACA